MQAMDPGESNDAIALRERGREEALAGRTDVALPLLQRAHELGDAEATFALGSWHQWGIEFEECQAKAFPYMLAAAEAGYAPAFYNLAIHYEGGQGCTPDLERALEWYERAANFEDPKLAYEVARVLRNLEEFAALLQPRFGSGLSWIERAAHAGNEEAMYELACRHELGKGIPVDLVEAKHWFTKAAEAGVQDAQIALDDLAADEQAAD